MRITYAVPRYLPHLGGIELHVAALATRMAASGHEVTVATQACRKESSALVERPQPNLTIRRFPSVLDFRGQGVSVPLWRWLRTDAAHADIVHVHNYHAASSLGLLLVARRPVVFTPHYLELGDGPREAALHAGYALAMRGALRRAAEVICVSESEAAAFERRLKSPQACHVIPNGVDTASIAGTEAPECTGRLVVLAGRLEPHKRADVVLEALADLPDDYRLALIGAGTMLGSLRDRAAAVGLADRVLFTGPLSVRQAYAWYRAADVVVTLSRRECFGMTIAEGLAAGANVVATDIGPHRDVLRLAGSPSSALLVPRDAGPSIVSRAILELGRRPSGAEPPRLPSWDEVAGTTLQLYKGLLGPLRGAAGGYRAAAPSQPVLRIDPCERTAPAERGNAHLTHQLDTSAIPMGHAD